MKKRLLFLLLILYPLLSEAQSKISAPTAIWPELQLNYAVNDAGMLFFRNQYRINTDENFNDLKESGILSNFERIELTLGYEHTFTDHWRGGALLRYAAEDYPKTMFYTLFLRHNGQIKSLYFNKQLQFEYADQQDYDARGRFRLMAELGKQFAAGSKFLTPSVSYEAMVISKLGQKYEGQGEERTIDRTRLRVNLTYELSDKVRLTPYFMRQTDYYYVLIPPVYNDNNVLVEDGYTAKRNRVSPVFGLELKYTFNAAPQTASFTY
ncbi:DUF2490 domain-containing protein [Pontibacter arcticus]|uniref:DUF2490 domain-containing protein n=1 Tax=Pontibacter arcticus TaxID=2080288 RepID=A0A364RHP4_9BACT|nr:DUF2490 domain-containing protein [Pontibacter arcticus]RAU83828.1 hypothetical protein DP923_01820 [Pontibacter arcticus]